MARLALAALLLTVPPLAGAAEPAFVVVLDPGHGGERSGAVGPSGATEKAITLQIAKKLATQLQKQGGKVILTRDGDTGVKLASRAALANQKSADLFVSIHLNSMPSENTRKRTRGVETYFLSADASDENAGIVSARENADRLAGEPETDPTDPVAGILDDLGRTESLQESSRLAYAIHERIVKASGSEDRGVKQAPFYVLAGARMPAVLLEVGFISNPDEERKLKGGGQQESIARAIAEGIAAFRKAAVAPAP
jgi:N-acetylmuramoyl-L-alanine amidase